MIASMVNTPDGRSVFVLVIERENFERMKKADPITLESPRRGGLMPIPRFPLNFSILIAYEEDDAEIWRLATAAETSNDFGELIRYLERGRTWNESTDGKKNAFHFRKGPPN